MRILVTGGAGFIGSNYVRYLLETHPSEEIVVLDKLTYAGNLENLRGVIGKISFVRGDIADRKCVDSATDGCDAIVNFAAETHVDRSIVGADDFIRTDVLGTYELLEAARRRGIRRFVQISTDEVYGSRDSGSYSEEDRLDPSSPYSASKSAGDLLAISFFKTYGLPVMVTRSTNNFGQFQHPEKLIPKFITNAIRDIQLPIYGDGSQVRDWLFVMDNCSAIDHVLRLGKPGDIYNIGAGNERTNIDITNLILEELGKPKSLIKFVSDRPGHDRRYSVDCTNIAALGWTPAASFEDSMRRTIRWYADNSSWWKPLVEGRIDFHGSFDGIGKPHG
jgi:dTDP-glucose 4,6-dehydratase